jgi:hypothetical protein
VSFSPGRSYLPIVTREIADIFRTYASDDVEFFPVDIIAARDSCEILNITARPDCLDEKD